MRAVMLLEEAVGRVMRRSSFYYSEPQDFVSDNSFVNCCLLMGTQLSPNRLLTATESIERQMGRTEKTQNGIHTDRIIDIDILLYDDLCLSTPTLTLPHPKMQERDFVMIPLKEILIEK